MVGSANLSPGVDIIERDVGILQRRCEHRVAEDPLDEDGAAGSEEGDFGHGIAFHRFVYSQ